MSLLGVDVGTTGCKAVAFSEQAQVLSYGYAEYDIKTPQPGYAELDTAEVWNKVKAVIAKAASGTGDDNITSLSITSLGEAMVPVTRDRKPLGDSILLIDTRGNEEVPFISSVIDNESLYQINGNTLGTHYSLPTLLWIKKNNPGLYARTDKFLLWSSFVAFMLGAEPAVDYSLANRTLLFDINEKQWSETIFNALDIDASKLPTIVASGTIIGEVSKEISQELSLPQNVKIVAGGHDQCANAVGCGVIEDGQVMYGMGTFLCAVPVFEKRPPSKAMIEYGLSTEDHVRDNRYVSFIYNQGGCLVKWFRDTFAANDHEKASRQGEEVYELIFSEMPDGPVDVTVLPYFTSTGPPRHYAAPFGLISGLNLSTTRGQILKGILQGATFYLTESIDRLTEIGLNVSEYRAVGGGSKSDRWVQLSADILGKPLLLTQSDEAGALGAAIIAGTGQGLFDSLEQGVAAMVRMERVIEPNMAVRERCLEQFGKYKQTAKLAEENFFDVSDSRIREDS